MIKYKSKPKVTLPPGPKGQGLMGNTKAFVNARFEMMRHCVEDYEGIVFTRIAFRNVYVVSKPEYVQRVLQKNAKNYHKSANYDGLRPILGDGLLTNEGESWFNQRKLMQPAFHREQLAAMVKVMDQRVLEAIHVWKVERQGQYFDIGPEMRKIASDIVTRCLFGTDVEEQSSQVEDLLQVLLKYANDKMVNPFRLGLGVPTRENKVILKAIADLDEIITKVVTTRRAYDGEPKMDLLQMLLDAKDAETGKGMTDRELRDELMTLYLAGQETTQHALTFTLYLLGRHSDCLSKLAQEVDGLKAFSLSQLQELSYTKQCIDESLRLYPPIWAVSRRAMIPDTLGPFVIPKDATVFVPIWAIHRASKDWKNPAAFDPSRFDQKARNKIYSYTYFPFGAGPRICIGNHFAMLEMLIVLARIVQSFAIELQDSEPLEVVTNMTMRPKGKVMVKMIAK